MSHKKNIVFILFFRLPSLTLDSNIAQSTILGFKEVASAFTLGGVVILAVGFIFIAEIVTKKFGLKISRPLGSTDQSTIELN